jgi:hypothetical protein
MERQIPHYALGIVLAPMMGGPSFMAGLGLMALADRFPEALEVTSKDVTQALAFLAMSIVPGWIFAVIPCAIGAALMAQLGVALRWTRAPLVWALAGLLPAVIGSLFNDTLTGDALVGILIFGTPGIICALVCRKFTSWRDPIAVMEEPAVPPAVAV